MNQKEPVLVVLVTKNCQFCDELLKIWDKIVQAMLSIYPKLRFPVNTIETKQYRYPPLYVEKNTINYNLFPKDLSQYIIWYPMVMLIPGDSWDQCNEKLGLYNTAKLNHVQIMNSKMVDGYIKPYNQYNIKNLSSYTDWLIMALQNLNIQSIQPMKLLSRQSSTTLLDITSR
jgi:hypothetical protein